MWSGETKSKWVALGATILFAAFLVGMAWVYLKPATQLYDEPPQDSVTVLFIGNSHTAYYDLVGMVQRLAHHDPSTPTVWAQYYIRGGRSLENHSEDPAVHQMFEQPLDYVVLQGASLEPVWYPDHYVRGFVGLYERAVAAGAEVVLYDVWARAEGCPTYHRYSGIPRTPEEAQAKIAESAALAMAGTNARHARVSEAFERHRQSEASFPLHARDKNHARKVGIYLAALIIYDSLFDAPLPADPWRPRGISQARAEHLLGLARQVSDGGPR
jgi:hypothetical protein